MSEKHIESQSEPATLDLTSEEWSSLSKIHRIGRTIEFQKVFHPDTEEPRDYAIVHSTMVPNKYAFFDIPEDEKINPKMHMVSIVSVGEEPRAELLTKTAASKEDLNLDDMEDFSIFKDREELSTPSVEDLNELQIILECFEESLNR